MTFSRASKKMFKRILVTGATGFLGEAICTSLIKNGHVLFRNYRTSNTELLDGDLICDVKDISDIEHGISKSNSTQTITLGKLTPFTNGFLGLGMQALRIKTKYEKSIFFCN